MSFTFSVTEEHRDDIEVYLKAQNYMAALSRFDSKMRDACKHVDIDAFIPLLQKPLDSNDEDYKKELVGAVIQMVRDCLRDTCNDCGLDGEDY
jgi:hypothetical protein